MKFFDLEMDGFLAAGKRGRSVSWNEGNTCDNYKYTHGTNWDACMHNTFKDSTNDKCKTTLQPMSDFR